MKKIKFEWTGSGGQMGGNEMLEFEDEATVEEIEGVCMDVFLQEIDRYGIGWSYKEVGVDD